MWLNPDGNFTPPMSCHYFLEKCVNLFQDDALNSDIWLPTIDISERRDCFIPPGWKDRRRDWEREGSVRETPFGEVRDKPYEIEVSSKDGSSEVSTVLSDIQMTTNILVGKIASFRLVWKLRAEFAMPEWNSVLLSLFLKRFIKSFYNTDPLISPKYLSPPDLLPPDYIKGGFWEFHHREHILFW